MKHGASLPITAFIAMLTALLAGIPSTAAQGQNRGQAEQFYGAPAGWSLDADGASASTFISSVNSRGNVRFTCQDRLLGFHIALSASEEDQPTMAHDGLLQVYRALAPPGEPLIAHFTVRFIGDDTFHSARFRYPDANRSARLLQLMRDYPTGLQLHAFQLRHDRLTMPRRIDLYLPGIANDSGVPMEIALAVVEETCRRPR